MKSPIVGRPDLKLADDGQTVTLVDGTIPADPYNFIAVDGFVKFVTIGAATAEGNS